MQTYVGAAGPGNCLCVQNAALTLRGCQELVVVPTLYVFLHATEHRERYLCTDEKTVSTYRRTYRRLSVHIEDCQYI